MPWFTVTVLVLAATSLAFMAATPVGVRLGAWSGLGALALAAVGAFLGVLAIALAPVAAWRSGHWAVALVFAGLAALVLIVPVRHVLAARVAPSIHDVTTDTEHPPAFVALLPLRGPGASAPGYDGPAAAEVQRRAYPDVIPLVVTAPPATAFDMVSAAARELGWTIVTEDRNAGRLEATATTFWLGFVDDVVVRVRPEGTGSRIDVRSKSRVGRGDLGTNARRIRAFLAAVRAR